MQQQLIARWRQLRGRTYDLLDVLLAEDLEKTLPFPESATLYNQLWCMVGTTESFANRITTGAWQGWASSLAAGQPIDVIRAHLQASDEQLVNALQQSDPLATLADGSKPLDHFFRLVEHESHHHGQLINFIYALNLPIPESWAQTWALSR